MEDFNKVLGALMSGASQKVGQSVDTDTEVGEFGQNDSSDVAASESEKLVLILDGGIEIHIPIDIYHRMADTVNNNPGNKIGGEEQSEGEECEEETEQPEETEEFSKDSEGE